MQRIPTIILVFIFLVTPFSAGAITLNVNYPELGGVTPSASGGIGNVIAWIYYLAIALGAFLAVLVVAYGGFKYIMSFASPGQAQEGKSRITDALIGFALLLLAVVALRLINPAIVQQFSVGGGLNIEPVSIEAPVDGETSFGSARCLSPVDGSVTQCILGATCDTLQCGNFETCVESSSSCSE